MNQTTREMRTRKMEQKRLNQIRNRMLNKFHEKYGIGGTGFRPGEYMKSLEKFRDAQRDARRYAATTKRLGEALLHPAEKS